jgi:hypothetical protein
VRCPVIGKFGRSRDQEQAEHAGQRRPTISKAIPGACSLLRQSSGRDGQHHRQPSALRALGYDADLDAFHERGGPSTTSTADLLDLTAAGTSHPAVAARSEGWGSGGGA